MTDAPPLPRPCFREKHPRDNAPAVLATIMRHHGLRIDLITAGRAIPGHRRPDHVPTLLDLRVGAATLGLSAKGVRGTYDQLRAAPMPVIVHLASAQGGRFAVVHRADSEQVSMCDPAYGPLDIQRDAFCRIWSGHALVCEIAVKEAPLTGPASSDSGAMNIAAS
jgi:ATP-binding cassette, subfamily C, bacteriocin exporter